METGYCVAEIMTTNPISLESNKTMVECANLMNEKKVGSVLVIDNKKLVGILTEKDIVIKLVAKNLDASKVLVKDIMTKKEEMIFIEPGKDLYQAIVMMNEQGIRRLPVIENEELKGLITRNDILKIEPDLFEIMVEKIHLREEERKLKNIFNEDSEDSDDDDA